MINHKTQVVSTNSLYILVCYFFVWCICLVLLDIKHELIRYSQMRVYWSYPRGKGKTRCFVAFGFVFSFRVTQFVPEMSLFLVKIRGKNLFLSSLRLLRINNVNYFVVKSIEISLLRMFYLTRWQPSFAVCASGNQ